MTRVWSVEEANRALPYLREVLSVLIEQHKRAELARRALLEIEQKAAGNGHGLDKELEHRRGRLRDALSQVRQSIEQLRSLGCEIKDLETGLLDFPSIHNDREVLLCWRLDEPAVMYWHDRDKGFASRQPL
ncbi:MAG: DUF2203 domain-containing protein [Chloroflexota bacterium]|nr:DUF2203 domain-containing protein [Chloroflexota bacterium]